jgi:beta-glucosidase
MRSQRVSLAMVLLALAACSDDEKKVVPPVEDPCAVKVNTEQPVLGFAVQYASATVEAGKISPDGKPIGAFYNTTTRQYDMSQPLEYTYNHDGDPATAAIPVPYSRKQEITVEGLKFRDLNGNGALDKYEDWRYSSICRAKDLVTKMTVPQKVGLMSESSSIGGGNKEGVIDSAVDAVAFQQRRQSLIRFSAITGEDYAKYMNNIQAMCEGLPLGIPLATTADPVHFVTQSTDGTSGAQSFSITSTISQWPNPMGFGAINDENVTWQYGDTVRREFRSMGFTWQLGPMVDIATEPRWARFITTFGDNPQAVAKHGAACIRGFQGSDLRTGIAATMKHFPGAGADDDGKDSHNAFGRWNVFPGDNFEAHQIAFIAAIDAGAAAVMPCYSIFKGQYEYDPEQVAAATSKGLITDYLKNTLGFDGMVTGDWGVISKGFGLEALDYPERAAWFVKAGSHQLGSDSHTNIQAAFDQGLLTETEIDGAAEKILEMTFKLGLFENPYANPAAAKAEVRSVANLQAGFDAQKKAVVVLKNDLRPQGVTAFNPARLPILATRYQDVTATGNTANQPDNGEFTADANKNDQIEVYFDGVNEGLTGNDQYSAMLGTDYDYTSPVVGTPGTTGYALPVVSVAAAKDADIAILRITARKGTYSGLDAGVPLSFDWKFPGSGNDAANGAAAVKDAKKVIDLFRVRDGYKDSAGNAIAPTNSKLRIVLVMFMDRPSPVKAFVNGLKSLDELPGVPGSYPSVSNQANINPTNVYTTVFAPAEAHAGVDAFLVEFGAYDRALLDVLFGKHPIAGWTYGMARLPVEIPSSEEEVMAQFEDVPSDTLTPTYFEGAGSNLPTN